MKPRWKVQRHTSGCFRGDDAMREAGGSNSALRLHVTCHAIGDFASPLPLCHNIPMFHKSRRATLDVLALHAYREICALCDAA